MNFINEFLVCTAAGFVISIIAAVYMLILSHEDILNWWFRFGSRFQYKSQCDISKGSYWFYKPLWECEKCLAGQIGLWWYLKTHFNVVFSQFKPVFSFPDYSILLHIYTVCISILLARVFALLFIKNNI